MRFVSDPLLQLGPVSDRQRADAGLRGRSSRHVELHLQHILELVWHLPVRAQLQTAEEGVRVTQHWEQNKHRLNDGTTGRNSLYYRELVLHFMFTSILMITLLEHHRKYY